MPQLLLPTRAGTGFVSITAESDTGTPRIAADLRTITAWSREERFARTTADAGAVGLPSRLGV